jgi:peptidoglycan/LPS O-acetylase OafA/YrhL
MTGSRHLPALDGIRGLAVLIVVLYHFGGGAQSPNPIISTAGHLLQAGWSGVTLFFILSGFLITGILWDARGGHAYFKNFYIRRTLRIFPLYYASLLLVFVAALIDHDYAIATHLWVYALYLQQFPYVMHLVDFSIKPFPIYHFWSLAVEEQFYLVWPFLISRLKTLRQARNLSVGVFLASFVFRLALPHITTQPGEYAGLIFSHMGELALGAWLAISYRDGTWPHVARYAVPVAPIALVGFFAFAAAAHSFRPEVPWIFTGGLTCITLFWGSFFVLSFRPGILHSFLCLAWLRWVGSISYGVYIFHVLLSGYYRRLADFLLPHGSRNSVLLLDTAIVLFGSILMAWLSFRFFETPILRLKSRFQTEPPSRYSNPTEAKES